MEFKISFRYKISCEDELFEKIADVAFSERMYFEFSGTTKLDIEYHKYVPDTCQFIYIRSEKEGFDFALFETIIQFIEESGYSYDFSKSKECITFDVNSK